MTQPRVCPSCGFALEVEKQTRMTETLKCVGCGRRWVAVYSPLQGDP